MEPLLNIDIYAYRGGNKIIFTLARLASESNFKLASGDLHSPGGQNRQSEIQSNCELPESWCACRQSNL